jgi:GR25 family glycosyltransferase involved in LPS biosynthesis
MKAFVITVKGNKESEEAAAECIRSSDRVNDFTIKKFDAYTKDETRTYGLKWNYPWEQKIVDFKSGLLLQPYPTVIREKRIGCFLSHWKLWTECFNLNEPFLILEHDAVFLKRLDFEKVVKETPYDITGINNPLGATRLSSDFYRTIMMTNEEYQRAPEIDHLSIPQGLAGNSAYIIKPKGAEHMIELVHEYGAWPNDAIMCRQLVPSLGVTKTFYTQVQGRKSTTTL